MLQIGHRAGFFLNIANTNVSESNANTTFLNGTFTNQMIAEYIPTLVDSISMFFVRRKFRFLSVPKYSKIIQNLMLVGYDIFFLVGKSHNLPSAAIGSVPTELHTRRIRHRTS